VKLQEFRSREILAGHGVPTLLGEVATTPEQARDAAARIGRPVVVKAQVLAGGRGKAGGVKLAATPDEAKARAADILGLVIGGSVVRTLFIVPAVDIAHEYYLAVVLDRAAKAVVIIASAEGGVEIEEVAHSNPDAVLRHPLDPLASLQPADVDAVTTFLAIPEVQRSAFRSLLAGLVAAFFGTDAELAEINPMAVTGDGHLLALDAKMVVDDSALPRHPDIEVMRDLAEEEPAEIAARAAGISYIKLDGTIGCMVNGAGLAMTTMDLVKLAGGEPANFLDIGGGARHERVAAAFGIILADPNVRAVLINIFGGITRGDEVAHGIVEARAGLHRDVPMVVRIVGTNADEAALILEQANLQTAYSLDEAAELAVAAAGIVGAG
jgi:succinyl-CoA synthetase beta subunit